MNNYKLFFFVLKIMKQKEPKEEPLDENPTLEDLRAELSLWEDEPSDSDVGWDLGKEEGF